MNIIFLDIDGVLNGYNSTSDQFWKIIRKLHLYKFLCKFYDRMGINLFKLFLLKLLVKKTNSKIVLSSSLRSQWKLPIEKCSSTMKSLKRKLKLLHMDIFDITPKIYGASRGEEIQQWLQENEVKNFVILDDELFNFDEYFSQNLILTSKNGIIMGYSEEDTGLKIKHILKAIRIFGY